jgi:hypothetical protein
MKKKAQEKLQTSAIDKNTHPSEWHLPGNEINTYRVVFHNEIQQAVQFFCKFSAGFLELLLCGETQSHIQKAQDRCRSTDDVGNGWMGGEEGAVFLCVYVCILSSPVSAESVG